MNGQTTTFTWDDEDRLTATSSPRYSDAFSYTALGLRLTKNDSTGGYAYLCDGVSPAASILSDGRLSFTPGISQTLGTSNGAGGLNYASHFYVADAIGNLRGMTDGGAQGFSDGLNFDGFGTLVGRMGSTSVPLGYGEGSGYVTDADTGLRLLGHRYYDSRTGRFISQDPKGAGNNWYAYAGNDPMNRTDALGLDAPLGDFGLRPGEMYDMEPLSAARAGMNQQLNQSSGLIARFQYYSVDKITYIISTGAIIGFEHLFDFAVPIGTSLMGNFQAARTYAGPHYLSLFGRSINMGHPTPVDDALYVRHHFANDTVGDFKDKVFLGIGRPSAGTRLYDLADNGGNINGGMGMEALGLSSEDISLSGSAHRAWQTQFRVWRDDPMGAAVLQVGYNYALQRP